MIRLILILFLIPFILIYTIFDAVICFFVSKVDKLAVSKHNRIVVQTIFRIIVFISGVKINVVGLENIKFLNGEKSFFAISNHRGFFDIITGYLLFEKDTAIVAKNNFEKIPLLHYWMKRINCIFLDRSNIRDGMRMVLTSISYINDGISVWVFPEGTRCKNENPLELLEFKQGAFKIAEKTNCYILPISFRNTESAFEKHIPWVKSAQVYINIGVPYKMSELSEDNRNNIAKYSQEVIRNLLAEEKKWQML